MRTSFLLFFVLMLGCDENLVIGANEDAGPRSDAAVMMDGAIAMDATTADAGPGEMDASVTRDAGSDGGVVDRDSGPLMGDLYADISLHSSIPSMAQIGLSVQLRDHEMPTPELRELDVVGGCRLIEQRAAEPAELLDLGEDAVSYRVDDGPWRPIPFLDGSGYYTSLDSSLSPGTPIDVRIEITGRGTIERTLQLGRLRQTTPTPIAAAINWRYTHAAGTDLSLRWTEENTGEDIVLVAVRDPLGMEGREFHMSASCEASVSAEEITLPWAILNQLADADVGHTAGVWLASPRTEETMEMGVVVRASSNAVAEIANVYVGD